MTYTVTIDWLSFTLKYDTMEARDVLLLLNPDGIMEPDKARFGYDRAARSSEGAIILTSASNPSMGCHAIISGSALQAYSERGTTCLKILQGAIAAKAKITRLDLAKDAQNEQFQLSETASLASKGIYSGTAQKCATINSSDGGLTLYIGSRQSERFLRVYDKGVQSGEGGDWIRLEMETKGLVANMLAKAIASEGVSINTAICESVKKMCQIENDSWRNILIADADWSAPKVEKQSDTEAWINSQVGQAVLNHLERNPDSPAVRRLYELLKARLN